MPLSTLIMASSSWLSTPAICRNGSLMGSVCPFLQSMVMLSTIIRRRRFHEWRQWSRRAAVRIWAVCLLPVRWWCPQPAHFQTAVLDSFSACCLRVHKWIWYWMVALAVFFLLWRSYEIVYCSVPILSSKLPGMQKHLVKKRNKRRRRSSWNSVDYSWVKVGHYTQLHKQAITPSLKICMTEEDDTEPYCSFLRTTFTSCLKKMSFGAGVSPLAWNSAKFEAG